jgi:preprotein translocase subunit YajC
MKNMKKWFCLLIALTFLATAAGRVRVVYAGGSDPVLVQPGSSQSDGSAAAETPADSTEEEAPAGGLFSSLWPILMWVGIAVLVYFLMYRAPKKEQKKKQALRNSIKVGDSVMTNAGLFGRIAEIYADSFVIEFGTNKGIRIPVLKDAVESVREPKLTTVSEIEEKK